VVCIYSPGTAHIFTYTCSLSDFGPQFIYREDEAAFVDSEYELRQVRGRKRKKEIQRKARRGREKSECLTKTANTILTPFFSG
jgi:hypothetical protein